MGDGGAPPEPEPIAAAGEGVVLRRSATIYGRFAAFCNDLGSFCCVLQRFGFVLLRSATIWVRFAAFCNDLGSFCAVLQRFGVHSPGNELML